MLTVRADSSEWASKPAISGWPPLPYLRYMVTNGKAFKIRLPVDFAFFGFGYLFKTQTQALTEK